MLGDLAKSFLRNVGRPFLLGQRAGYDDFNVGAWLRMAQQTLPEA